MASSSSSQSYNYDVFLSFRGEDTRKTFVDHLYSALVDCNIITYKDNETLPRGESIRPSLYQAIEGSRIAVIIFSKNYADSSWCLDELAYIVECKVKRGLTVMPVFYDVAPSEVRKQEGDFGRGFAKQEVQNISKVERWRKALVDVSDISGWEPKNIANGHESKVIKEIADKISKKLFSVTSSSGVDKGLVGMDVRLQELEAELDVGSSDDVKMVGIWGVGGSGKTTLAYALYKKISHNFQSHCIIDNIREESSKHDGLKILQEKLLSRLSKTETKLQIVDEGKDMIRSRLNHSNVLIILDDVDDDKQLDALAGSLDWFGSGSRIIVTTRDEHMLRNHVVFPIRLLSDEEAVQLFNKRAFNEKRPLKDYDKLSSLVVDYAARLPLALKVLGSFLYDKDEKQWRSTLDRLKDTPQTKILEQLKISYDGLESLDKDIFLDIACFWRREKTYKATEILEACGYHPVVGIEVLRQKALITIVDGKFDMHDLVQEMGHHIVRGEHPHDPKRHMRLWKYDEIKNMSDATTENDQIEAIGCIFHRYGQYSSILSKSISNMKKLRYLYVKSYNHADKNVNGPNFLSNELCFLEWFYYPRSPFPGSFKAGKLVILKLIFSWQKKLWKGYKHLPHLKVLQLSWMENLVSTPDFDGLPSLQKLTLSNCKSLERIHPSLGKHSSLEHVSVVYCWKLRMFPTIIHMRKLKTLEIKSCHKSLKLTEIKSNMDNLVKLSLKRVGIDVLLPSVVERCANLISLRLSDCSFLMDIQVNFDGLKQLEEFQLKRLNDMCVPYHTIFTLLIGKVACGRDPERSPCLYSLQFELPQLPCNVRKLNLISCRLKDGEIPSCIGEMSNLEDLNLSHNDFTRLDFNVSQLTLLKYLCISCTKLVEFPKLPSSLIVLKADYCMSLTTTGDFFTNCKRLCHVSLTGVRLLNGCNSKLLESMLQGNAIENHCMRLDVEGIEIVKGFIPPLIEGGRRRLRLPENWCNDFSGFLMCTVESKYSVFGNLTMEQVVSGMESEDDEAWEDSESESENGNNNDRRRITRVWYVSFASLKHTIWWNSISKPLSISFKLQLHEPFGSNPVCSGFGVTMVARKSRNASSMIQEEEESEFSWYTPKIHILHDSQYLLTIWNTRW